MSKPAPSPVIVIDLQTGMFDGLKMPVIHGADALVSRVRAVTQWARRAGRPVAFVRHDGAPEDALAPGKVGWPVWPALGQCEGEPTFSKSVGDSFSQPALVRWLEDQGAEGVILMGAQTDACVAATVKGALDRGLKVTVVGDGHSTWPWAGKTAEQIIAHHNALFADGGAEVVTTDALIGA